MLFHSATTRLGFGKFAEPTGTYAKPPGQFGTVVVICEPVIENSEPSAASST